MSATITLLKNRGVFYYTDYDHGKAAQRLNEELPVENVQPIARSSGDPVVAYLMSASFYDASVSALGFAPTIAQTMVQVPDDYVGSNLSKMVDLIQSNAQTASVENLVVDQGSTSLAYKSFQIINTREFFEDGASFLMSGTGIGGVVVGYLVHPSVYTYLTGTPPAPPTYSGTGNGFGKDLASTPGSLAETITLTCITAVPNGGVFSVVGSVSGALPNATVGVAYSSAVISFVISAGSIDYVVGDTFIIHTIAGA